ncbi:coat protein [Lake Sarah-associated circular virus-45]|uniref:Coat protein n=1 Tax=Lake Sarah-associated circular virus-45 TaxID=1685774 RepID=A0A140AQR0_9VIRU|nr:coat protein [Lake Sarah-associated circular virus-45]ALE29796.1 coat protein [Lake Sarah-associated circular virus-45]
MKRSRKVAYNTPPNFDSPMSTSAGRIISLPRRGRGRSLSGRGTLTPRNLFGTVAKTVASAHPYGRAALNLYRGARAISGIFKSRVVNTPGLKRRTTGGPNARFVGPFKKPKKLLKPSMFATKGFVHTCEINGTVSDPDCVYIGHSTFSGIMTLELLCQVLLRKLFAKAGIVLRDINEPLRGYVANTSSMWRIDLIRHNKETNVYDVAATFTTPSATNTNIYQIVGDRRASSNGLFPGLYNTLYDAAVGANGSDNRNVWQPSSLVLYQEEENITQFFQFRAEIKFDNETVHCFSKSDLKVQNRSVSASAGTTSDAVDANPLMGKLYHFKGGCPRSRIVNAALVESVPDLSGVITARAASLVSAGAQAMSEPPRGNAWWNCSGTSGVKLQPGHIKYDSVYYQNAMPILKFLTAMNMASGPTGKQIHLFGKSSLLALEDVINVNAAQNITCSYECNRRYGIYLTTKTVTFAQGLKYAITQNDLT